MWQLKLLPLKQKSNNLCVFNIILHNISVTSVCVHKSAIQGLMRRWFKHFHILRKSDNARQGRIQRLFWPQRSDFVLHKCIGIFPDKIKSRRIHTTMYIPFNIFDIYVQNGTFFHKTDTLGNLCYNHHSCIRCDNQRRQLNGRILYSLLYDSDLHRIKIKEARVMVQQF